MDTTSLTITDALKLFSKRDATPQSLAEACFDQINRLNPTLNAYITVIEPKEMLKAQRPPANTAPLNHALRGIPIAIKDLFDTEGIRTTAGSKFFADHIPDEDAFVVDKLKQAGALINGKTNSDEFAFGVTGINAHYGNSRNPWNTDRIPGGSSSGSAIAVATGMALGALGSDTGGSIRIPASLCGIVGFKPTRGRVSSRSVFPLSWNLDHVGPLTKCVKDAAIILQIISAYDAIDPSSIKMLTGDYLGHLIDDMHGSRVALASGDFIETADPEVVGAVREAAKVFEGMGCNVSKINVDWLGDVASASSTMLLADGAAVHKNRFGEHPELFGDNIRPRVEKGASLSATEYALARKTQAEAKKRFELFFESYDFLILPSTPIAAPPIAGLDALEQAGSLNLFTKPFNLTGLPALSVPCGFTSEGLPIGLQIVAKAWGDAKALTAGYAYEQATEWHKKFPVL